MRALPGLGLTLILFARLGSADVSAPDPAFSTEEVRRGALVADGRLVITTRPDPRWEVVVPDRSYREALTGVLDEARLPASIRALRGTPFRLLDGHGFRCTGVVTTFALVTIGRDRDSSESGGLGYVDGDAARAKRILVAELRGAKGCAEAAVFANAVALPQPPIDDAQPAGAELRARFGDGWEVTTVRDLVSVARRRKPSHFEDYDDAWRLYRLDGRRLVRLRAPQAFFPGHLYAVGDTLYFDDGDDGRGTLRRRGDTVVKTDEVPVYRWCGMP